MPSGQGPINKPLERFRLDPQTEMLQVQPKTNQLFIGVPKERVTDDHRIALVPSGVHALTSAGHRVRIESGAGELSYFFDNEYSEAGAEIVYSSNEVYEANCILKVALPSVEELKLYRPGQLLISPLTLPFVTDAHIEHLLAKRVTALAMEYLKDKGDSFPIVRMMSELAGINAVLIAADHMTIQGGGKGMLLGGISGIPPANVVILGSGVVAESAARTALGLGASVMIFDENIYKLMRIQNMLGQQVPTSVLNPIYLKRALESADLVIGAIHSQSARTPVVVSEEMVQGMKNGSMIVDVSIDQGGCVATSEITTHQNPIFERYGVIHYGVPNISSRVARTASMAISNILSPILMETSQVSSIDALLYSHAGFRHGVYAYKGKVTNQYLANRFSQKFTDLDLLLTAHI